MAGLQVLEEQFSAEGLHVLAFYSNDFGAQGGTEGQIETCTNDYMVTFEGFDIAHVIDPDGGGPEEARDVFGWILSQPDPGPANGLEPTWNFHKYLIGRDGQLVAHFGRNEYPGDDPADPNDDFDTNEIVVAIRAELAR
jgi:glutathione peroxidase